MSISGVGLSRTAINGLCNKCAKSSDVLIPLLVKNMAQFGFMDLCYCINCFSNLIKKKEITA
jgi:predicted DNA-binding helix-hairpin-helix protein